MKATTRATIAAAALGKDVKVTLSVKNEALPVNTSASGEGTISIADDGSVTTKGVQDTAAHIPMGREGANGPVIVPFTKDGDTCKAPPGAPEVAPARGPPLSEQPAQLHWDDTPAPALSVRVRPARELIGLRSSCRCARPASGMEVAVRFCRAAPQTRQR
jgi:hypothetical protein